MNNQQKKKKKSGNSYRTEHPLKTIN